MHAASVLNPPSLPPPSGTVVHVSSEPELQAAVRNLTSNSTILIAPGTYRLTATLHIGNRALQNVTLRGATDRREDVVLAGPGMTNASYGSAPNGIWVGNGVDGVRIANLTVTGFYFHPIILNPGTRAPHIYNVRLLDSGEQLLKGNPDSTGRGIEDGVVEYSVFEYTTRSRDYYTNGVDVLGGSGWIIRDNLFQNIHAPAGQLAGPAILMWRGSSGTIAERNTFINCQREIAFGLVTQTPNDHTGGIIRNNFIYRDSWVAGDAGINVFDSPGTLVLHNTVITNGTYPNAIEYRFPDSQAVQIVNNLTDAAIRARDGATATLAGNYTAASLSMFVAPSAGDLHLTGTATAAVDRGVPVSGAETDWDGEARPSGSAPDIGADERPVAVANAPPAVSLTAPAPGATFTAPATISLAAQAGDSDGSVVRVDFIANGSVVGSDATAPYSFTWTGVAAGTYTIGATAIDNAGAVAHASTVTIAVSAATTPPSSSTTRRAIADTHVQSGRRASVNFGSATQLEVNGDPTLRAEREAYLMFDVSGLSTVSGVRLRLSAGVGGRNPAAVEILTVGTAWTETSLTWDTRPSPSSGPLGGLAITGSAAWYDVDVTTAVRSAAAAGQTHVAFLLRSARDADKGVTIPSRESGLAPELVVEP